MRWSYLSHVGPRQVEIIQCIFIYIIYPESLFLFVSFLATLKKLFFLLLSFIVSCVFLLIFLLTAYLLSTLWCFEMMMVLYKQVWQSNYLRNCLKIFTETLSSSTGCSWWWSDLEELCPALKLLLSSGSCAQNHPLCCPEPLMAIQLTGPGAGCCKKEVGGGAVICPCLPGHKLLPVPVCCWQLSDLGASQLREWYQQKIALKGKEFFLLRGRGEVEISALFYFLFFSPFFFFLFETASFQVQQRYALGYGINSIYTSLKCLGRNST